MMRRGKIGVTTVLLLAWGLVPGSPANGTNDAPDFQEIYKLLRENLVGVNGVDLNRLAVEGLLSRLGPKASLVGGEAAVAGAPEGSPLDKVEVFDGGFACLRVTRVDDDVAGRIREACNSVSATNKLPGIVLDLRFASGQDYQAAANAAEVFLKSERALLDWGKGMVRSKASSNAVSVPVAVLINRATSGSAEALAAVLREAGAGLLLGSRSAGQAMIAKEFPLGNGQRLRLAISPIRLGDGSVLTAQGVAPDIAVQVAPADERAYYADAFTSLTKSNAPGETVAAFGQTGVTNRGPRRPRFNEAELVRERRDEADVDEVRPGRRDEGPERPVVYDPVLARALDLLKGLALVRQSRR